MSALYIFLLRKFKKAGSDLHKGALNVMQA